MPKKKVDAIYDDDLIQMLESLGLKNKFLGGKLTCAFCRDIITWENLHSIFPHGGEIKVSCTKPECVRALVDRIEL